MRQSLQLTEDGSHTVLDKELNVTFHSKHGALQESKHVFINAGLRPLLSDREQVNILETGFGTGLNAILTMLEADRQKRSINYLAYDLYPIPNEIYSKLNYPDLLGIPPEEFQALHSAPWGQEIELSAYFSLKKVNADFTEIAVNAKIDLIYLDAFAPGTQAAFWESAFITRLARSLRPGGTIVTYCAKGSFKRALKAVGLEIEALPGPPGKREMTRAILSSKP